MDSSDSDLRSVPNGTASLSARLRGYDVRAFLIPLSILGALFVAASFVPQIARSHGYDLYAFWTVNLEDPYGLATGQFWTQGSFHYAPPLILVVAPLRLLPWEAVEVGWLVLQLAALWYVGRRWFLALVLLPPVWSDIVYGNINIFLAAMIVAGFRNPGAWAFALLTKVTPAVGLVWFALRLEWRALAIALVTTVGIGLVSVLVLGVGVWGDWFLVLSRSSDIPLETSIQIPLPPRLALAAIVLVWGAATNRSWTVPVAVTVAMPTLWVLAFAPLVALAAWMRGPADRRAGPPSVASP